MRRRIDLSRPDTRYAGIVQEILICRQQFLPRDLLQDLPVAGRRKPLGLIAAEQSQAAVIGILGAGRFPGRQFQDQVLSFGLDCLFRQISRIRPAGGQSSRSKSSLQVSRNGDDPSVQRVSPSAERLIDWRSPCFSRLASMRGAIKAVQGRSQADPGGIAAAAGRQDPHQQGLAG